MTCLNPSVFPQWRNSFVVDIENAIVTLIRSYFVVKIQCCNHNNAHEASRAFWRERGTDNKLSNCHVAQDQKYRSEVEGLKFEKK